MAEPGSLSLVVMNNSLQAACVPWRSLGRYEGLIVLTVPCLLQFSPFFGTADILCGFSSPYKQSVVKELKLKPYCITWQVLSCNKKLVFILDIVLPTNMSLQQYILLHTWHVEMYTNTLLYF